MRPTVYWVEVIGRGQLFVMAKPVAGEWIGEEFAGIAAAGITRVVSLLEAKEAYELGLQDEARWCTQHEMDFINYPIADRGVPSVVREFALLTRKVHNDIATGMNTVIHCRAGIGRTGLVAAGVLLHTGLEPAEAFESVSRARGVQVPDTDEQCQWLLEHENEVRGWGKTLRIP